MSKSNGRFKTRMLQLLLAKSAREGHRITFDEVAEATGLGRSTIIRYTNKEISRPDWAVVETLCDYFGVSLMEFIDTDR